MRKSGLTGDEAYILAKHGETTEDLGPLKKEIGLIKEDLSNKITKFYASNQGEIHITDSDNGKIQNMMLYGKSEQFTTIGKNLLKIKDGTQTLRGVTVTAKDGVVALKGTATESGWTVLTVDSFVLDGTYILSSNITANIRVLVANKSFETVLEQGKSATLENVEASRVCFTVTEGKTYDISNILVQIEKGSKSTSYEPYTGGIPSPNPSYPQEIKSVVNPTVKVCGKNLLDCRSTLSKTDGGLSFINNKDGSFSISGKNTWTYRTYDIEFMVYQSGTYKAYRGTNSPIPLVIIYDPEARENVAVITDSGETFQLKKGKLYYYSIAFTDVNLDIDVTYKPFLTLDVKGTYADYEPYTEQSITLPHTLNAISVTSGGNVTIDGQQYITDYVNVERGKLVKMVDSSKLDNTQSIVNKTEWLLAEPQEIDLTTEEITAFKALATYYSTTNISVNSEQLDGYTVFNYPISMQNGWNYVKQQLNDNRDYIYDMDTQSAEAYVNSEYAVALTELEV